MQQRLRVPCGHCADCLRVMHNEWFFRAFVEYRNFRKCGAVYFVTLTYNNDYLPVIDLPNGKKQYAFNRTNIHNFVKYMRIWLKRHGFLHKGIKYMICSEYGDTTDRPHHHMLLYCPFHLPNFRHFIESTWKYGFVLRSPDFGWEVKTSAGIDYATKYVCKDYVKCINGKDSNLSKYLDTLSDDEREKYLDSIKNYLPKHWQSCHFGESFIDSAIKVDERTQRVRSEREQARFLAENKYTLVSRINGIYPIPRYYHLKMEKHISKFFSKETGRVVQYNTSLGEEVKAVKAIKRLTDDQAVLRMYPKTLNMSIPPKDIYCDMQAFYKDRKIFMTDFQKKIISMTPDDFIAESTKRANYVIDHLANNEYYLSLYRCFVRNFPCVGDETPDSLFANISDIIISHIVPRSVPPEYAEVGLVPVDGNVEIAVPISDMEDVRQLPRCACHLKSFSYYEQICQYMDWLDIVISLRKEYNYILKQEDRELKRKAMRSKPRIYKSKT